MSGSDTSLLAVLETSRSLGFLGPGPVGDHVVHAGAFVPLIPQGGSVLDLGSGGGLPGLVVARTRSDLRVVLVDSRQRRTDFLLHAVQELDLAARVEVRTGRAEELAHEPELRHAFDVVVSRSFGPPAVTAECAAGFLRGPGSLVLVSEPPDEDGGGHQRWPAGGLAELGLRRARVVNSPAATIQLLESEQWCDDRFPRAIGRPAKRPLF